VAESEQITIVLQLNAQNQVTTNQRKNNNICHKICLLKSPLKIPTNVWSFQLVTPSTRNRHGVITTNLHPNFLVISKPYLVQSVIKWRIQRYNIAEYEQTTIFHHRLSNNENLNRAASVGLIKIHTNFNKTYIVLTNYTPTRSSHQQVFAGCN